MNFDFSDEQQMLQESTRRVLAAAGDFEQRNAQRDHALGYSTQLWRELADLGLLALNIPEADGGIGAGAVDNMLVCEAMGEGLVLEPFHASAVEATSLLARLADEQQRQRWLPALASGELIAVLAHAESSNGGALEPTQTRARPSADGWQLDGHKSMIYHAPSAALLLVSAQIEGAPGLALFAVPADAAGLSLTPVATLDAQRAADVVLRGVQVGADARIGSEISKALSEVLDFSLAALCADAFGAIQSALNATIEYSRERKQFGQPIGRFQALQHRMADMLIHAEQARSMCYLAASHGDDPDPAQRRRILSAAKALIGQAARKVGQEAVQLHGGMGMTDELKVSHYFRRLTAFELRGGSTASHLQRLATDISNDRS
ncbi:MAG: acyl-CoA dehydrogenase family protein [Xanthomonadales bacterium]|nr:acyl-CoA dehydrogenase family protein [Xanthomonadales bacterium]